MSHDIRIKRKDGTVLQCRKQNPKGTRQKESSDYDSLVESISSLANSMMAIYRQSYDVLLPIVDDICQRKESVTQNELEHCFDYLLNISCTDFGKKLFDRVCVTFKSKYPDSVEFYVKENESLYGNDAADDDAMQSDITGTHMKCGQNFRPQETCRGVGASPKTSRKKKSNALRSKESSLETGLRSEGGTGTEGEDVKGDVITWVEMSRITSGTYLGPKNLTRG